MNTARTRLSRTCAGALVFFAAVAIHLSAVGVAAAAGGGASSPGTAVTAYFKVEETPKHMQGCPYVQPSAQKECNNDGGGEDRSSVKVVKTVIVGDRALVALVGHSCVDGPSTRLRPQLFFLPGCDRFSPRGTRTIFIFRAKGFFYLQTRPTPARRGPVIGRADETSATAWTVAVARSTERRPHDLASERSAGERMGGLARYRGEYELQTCRHRPSGLPQRPGTRERVCDGVGPLAGL